MGCRPLSRRIINPDKIRNFHTKLQLTKYGSSCFMQLLDDEPSPKKTHLDQIKTERLAQAAAAKKKKFKMSF